MVRITRVRAPIHHYRGSGCCEFLTRFYLPLFSAARCSEPRRRVGSPAARLFLAKPEEFDTFPRKSRRPPRARVPGGLLLSVREALGVPTRRGPGALLCLDADGGIRGEHEPLARVAFQIETRGHYWACEKRGAFAPQRLLGPTQWSRRGRDARREVGSDGAAQVETT